MKPVSISSQISAVEIAMKIISGAASKPRNPSQLEKLQIDLAAVIATLHSVEQEAARERFLDGAGKPA